MRVASPLSASIAIRPDGPRWSTGIASLDATLGGGMTYGRLHEIYAVEGEDAAVVAGLAMAMTAAMGKAGQTIFWLHSRRDRRQGRTIQANGWAELGGRPGNVVFGALSDTMSLLRAAIGALQCKALCAVIVESQGQMRELDLTASRRLALAAEKSDVPLFLLRIDATPVPSAAQTRWQVAAAPSQALPGNAPGRPTFDIELLRQKSGPSGMRWRLEWDRDQCRFREIEPAKAALPGTVVSVPPRRPAADTGNGSAMRIGQRAA